MSGRRKPYKPRSFESTGVSKDTSANIYESMLQSAAFKDLTPKQRLLYLYCKAQYYGKRKPERDYPDIEQFQGDDLFYFPMGTAEKYGLYTRSNHTKFYDDMRVLEEHGFIEIVSHGKAQRKKSIYRYSGKWRFWNSS